MRISVIHENIIDLVARRFQVLGEPCRLRILQALQQGDRTVNEIVEIMGATQPNVSKHLQILFDAEFVSRERSGNSIIYSITDPVVFKLCDLVCRSTARHAAHVHKYANGGPARKQVRQDRRFRRSQSTMQGVL
jgi:DNA-binding transcriptional ArsR family regulator